MLKDPFLDRVLHASLSIPLELNNLRDEHPKRIKYLRAYVPELRGCSDAEVVETENEAWNVFVAEHPGRGTSEISAAPV